MNIPIDNSAIEYLGSSSHVPGFVPAASFSYNAGAHTMTVTDASAFPAGDGLSIMHIHVNDGFGGEKYDKITVAGGVKAVDVSSLDPLEGLTLRITFVTTNKLTADGGAYKIGSTAPVTGNVRYINKSNC